MDEDRGKEKDGFEEHLRRMEEDVAELKKAASESGMEMNKLYGAGTIQKPTKEDAPLYDKLSPFRMAAKFTSIPMTLLACTVVGFWVGSFIEKKHPLNGVFIAVFTMLGVAAGFKEILSLLKEPEEKDKNPDEKDKKTIYNTFPPDENYKK